MEQQQLFNLGLVDQPVDDVVTVRRNLWLMTSQEIPPLLFNVDQVASLLGIGRHRVFDLIREGGLRSVKVGASRRISARALCDFVTDLEGSELGVPEEGQR